MTATPQPADVHPNPDVDRPSRAALKRGLAGVLAAEIAAHGPLKILHRRENPLVSSYVADIVHLRFADGHREHLLCKFAHGRELTPPTPHEGLAHEAQVYAEVLGCCPLDSPHVFGGFTDDETGDVVLVLRFYPDAVPAAKSTDPAAVDSLICWLAAFHEWTAARLAEPRWEFLARYDADLYAMWLERTIELAAPFAAECPWLGRVAEAYRERIPLLVAAPVAVIHGEFTTRNALWDHGRILPIDWETAAMGPPEVDLAVFTYDWHPENIAVMERTYVAARWGGTPPDGYADRLIAARLYAAFHWLFGTPGGCSEERVRTHLMELHAEAVRWGIVAE
ncbi:MAG: phosphotransferase family protein [Planctomycetaceae bacterium]